MPEDVLKEITVNDNCLNENDVESISSDANSSLSADLDPEHFEIILEELSQASSEETSSDKLLEEDLISEETTKLFLREVSILLVRNFNQSFINFYLKYGSHFNYVRIYSNEIILFYFYIFVI